MSEEELAYLRLRAEAELEQAQEATHPRAVAIHYQLANAYLERIESGESTELRSYV